jgi:hypothetical protein
MSVGEEMVGSDGGRNPVFVNRPVKLEMACIPARVYDFQRSSRMGLSAPS